MKKIKSEIHRAPFCDNPLFITGLTRSGKTMLSPIISSFLRVEKVNVNYQFEFESKCPINDIEEISPEVFSYTLINLKTSLPENNEQIILKYRKICMEKVTQLQKKPFKKIFPLLRL